jgi:tRNA(Ile2)-agmatinylcytidine synthase
LVMADFFLGLDSTDSLLGGCTTHVATLLVEEILGLGAEFKDYPHLVRLNPNIPFKTRGNGAVSLNFRLEESSEHRLYSLVEEIVTRHSDLPERNCDPGLVILKNRVSLEVQSFATKCLHEVVTISEAEELLHKYATHTRRWKLGRGLVGALAAIGLNLPPDYVFELIAYRHSENLGKPRLVDPASVQEMDSATRPDTINNRDEETGRVLITPRGPDPVLLGIRGETPEVLLEAFRMLRINEEVERWMIFRSNECTDSHLQPVDSIRQVRPYSSVILRGRIIEKPRIIRGGHVFVRMTDASGVITLAAYEPTGNFREQVCALMEGDQVTAAGGVKLDLDHAEATLNLESIQPTILQQSLVGNPTCKICSKRMKSLGRQKGYRCKKCRRRSDGSSTTSYPLARSLIEGSVYKPPARAHRHLTRPLSRRAAASRSGPGIRGRWCSFYPTPMKSL